MELEGLDICGGGNEGWLCVFEFKLWDGGIWARLFFFGGGGCTFIQSTHMQTFKMLTIHIITSCEGTISLIVYVFHHGNEGGLLDKKLPKIDE